MNTSAMPAVNPARVAGKNTSQNAEPGPAPNMQQPYFGQIFVAAELAAREGEFAVILIDPTPDPAWAQRSLIAGAVIHAGDNAAGEALHPPRNKILWIEA